MRERSTETDSGGAGREITAEDYRRLHRQLTAQIRRLGVPANDTEDLIQETFLYAQTALDRGQFEGRSSFDTWVVSIAKKRTLKYWRRFRTAKRGAEVVSLGQPAESAGGVAETVPSPDPDPEAQTSGRELLERTVEAIDELSNDFRAPLVLYTNGYTYEQIGSLLKIPSTLVTSRIHQARAKVRKNLAQRVTGASG